MNSLIKSATIIDKKSDFHNSKVDILIENNIITNIGKNLKNPKNYKEISFNNIQRNFLSNSFAALEKIIDPKKKDYSLKK